MKNQHTLAAKLYAATLNPDAQLRLDAADGALAFARQFEHIEAEINRTEFSPLKSELFIPYDFSTPPGSKSITHYTVTEIGQADFVNHYANNLPNADVQTREDEVKCEDLGVEYQYSVMDIQRAALEPKIFTLDAERKISAMNAIRRLHDEVAAVGSTKLGRTGFVNNASVPLVTVVTGTWATATSAQIIGDITKLWNSIPVATEDVIDPDSLILDVASYSIISTKPYGLDSNFTVLQWLKENLDGVKTIGRWNRLNTAGAGATKRMVAYRKSPDVVKYHAVEMFAEEAPQRKALKVITPCHGQTGFTEVRKPKGIAYMDGI